MRATLTLSVVAALVLAASAFGGERYLGTITTWDGGYAANMSLMDAGFPIGIGAKLSIQPDQHACVCVDSHVNNNGAMACNCTTGVTVPAGSLFQTSCSPKGSSFVIIEVLSDAGVYDGGRYPASCTVAVSALDAGTVNTRVFERIGTEAN